MAVEHLFAAVHIERRMAFAVQRTKSRNFLASLLASGLPTVLREKLQQRNAAGRREIRRHSWWRPRKSQAKMVGARKTAAPPARTVDFRCASAPSGGWWRRPPRGRHPDSLARPVHHHGRALSVRPQSLQIPRRTRIVSCPASCAVRRRRPCPTIPPRPQPGNRRGGHSPSCAPGLHPSAGHG